jgi:hypothetical protein
VSLSLSGDQHPAGSWGQVAKLVILHKAAHMTKRKSTFHFNLLFSPTPPSPGKFRHFSPQYTLTSCEVLEHLTVG